MAEVLAVNGSNKYINKKKCQILKNYLCLLCDGMVEKMDQNLYNLEPVIPYVIQENPTNVFDCINVVRQDDVKEEIKETNLETNVTVESGRNVGPSELNQHFQCEYCPMMFTNIRGFNMHMILHLGIKPFQCSKCFKKFTFIHHLQRHEKKTCRLLIEHQCKVCDQKFKNKRSLKKHMNVHSKEKPYVKKVQPVVKPYPECNICNKKCISKNSLKFHMKIHLGEKRFECSDCHQQFKYKFSWLHHTKPNVTKEIHSCTLCEIHYSRKSCLRQHRRMNHKTNYVIQKLYKCSDCDQQFTRHRELKLHRNVHSKTTCKICNKILKNKRTFKLHMRIHNRENIHACKKCDKVFIYKQFLNSHMRNHEKVGLQFACRFCDKSFVQKSGLLAHIRAHTWEDKHKCVECHKEFRRTNQLFAHLETHKSSSDRIKCCQICNKKYIAEIGLKHHMRIHTRKNLFTCNKCGKEFVRKDYWQIHLKSHLNIKFKRTCKICNSSFDKLTELKEHNRQAHPDNLDAIFFECAKCGRKFKLKYTLKRHLQTHVKGKLEMPCSICKKSFIEKDELDAHIIKIHKRKNMFRCLVCRREFNLKSSLVIHMENHRRRTRLKKKPKTISKKILTLEPEVPKDEIITESKDIKTGEIDLVETAIMEYITTVKTEPKIEETELSSMPCNICVEEVICKEEVIFPTEGI